MQVNYYRQSNAQGYDQSWQSCQFTQGTDLSQFSAKALVTINGQPYLRQHHITYLTGKETCRAHHCAKHLAIQVLNATPSTNGTSVMWIDTLNGPHVSAAIFSELSQHVQSGKALHYTCLDILGGQRDDHWCLTRNIEELIKRLKPQLVVIDDIDHFMPYCGPRVANEFNRVIRDAVNHTDAAFLFIGYNHTGKKACTAGELGKLLFTSSNDIFSLSTVREVTTVRHISGYDLSVLPDQSQFHFTIGPDNLPQETQQPRKAAPSGIDDDTLRDIVEGIIHPGQDITASDLLAQVKARHNQLKRNTRDAARLDQIHRLHLLNPLTDTIPSSESIPSNESSKSIPQSGSAVSPSELGHDVNNLLTLPTHPQPSVACPVGGGSAAVIPSAAQPRQAHDNPCNNKSLDFKSA